MVLQTYGLISGSHLLLGSFIGQCSTLAPPQISTDSAHTLLVRLHFTSTEKCSKRKRCVSFSQSTLEPERVLSPKLKFTLLIMRQ